MIKVITDLNYIKQKSENLTSDEIKLTLPDIIKELEESLDLKRGIGLSAIQIGIKKRVAIIRIGEKKINLINPRIMDKHERFKKVGEGCLSIPGLFIDTIRYNLIVVENDGKNFSAEGLEAVAIQHELDHMNGVTILERKWKRRK